MNNKYNYVKLSVYLIKYTQHNYKKHHPQITGGINSRATKHRNRPLSKLMAKHTFVSQCHQVCLSRVDKVSDAIALYESKTRPREDVYGNDICTDCFSADTHRLTPGCLEFRNPGSGLFLCCLCLAVSLSYCPHNLVYF